MTGKKIREGIFKWCKKEEVPHFNSLTPADRGEPDTKYLFSHNSTPVWVYIEIKGKGDRLTEAQKGRISLYRAYYQTTYVVKSIEEGIKILSWHQIMPVMFPHYSRDNEK